MLRSRDTQWWSHFWLSFFKVLDDFLQILQIPYWHKQIINNMYEILSSGNCAIRTHKEQKYLGSNYLTLKECLVKAWLPKPLRSILKEMRYVLCVNTYTCFIFQHAWYAYTSMHVHIYDMDEYIICKKCTDVHVCVLQYTCIFVHLNIYYTFPFVHMHIVI